jgi:hypothetical protein
MRGDLTHLRRDGKPQEGSLCRTVTYRRHSALDYVSPIEFELKFMSVKIEKMAA